MSSRDAPCAQAAALEAGSAAYRRLNLAMFIGGFTTFALLYAPQPLLPELARVFALSPATASLAVSAGTGALALLLIPASILSDRHGRVTLMKWSLMLASLIALASATVSDFTHLVVLRALLGATLAGLPAVAMAYLGDEVAPHAQARVMGLYIAGNALGGMSGRVFGGLLADFGSWRIALAVLGVLGVCAAVAFWRTLPASRRFERRSVTPRAVLTDARTIYSDPRLVALFGCGFLLMGAFFGVYNYLGFRLQAPPFSLPQSALGAIFLLYLMGSVSSAWAGRLSERFGRHNVLWAMTVVAGAGLAITLSPRLALLVLGVAVFTFGYFGAHSAAIGWVGLLARERRALASALYLGGYYLGSSLLGSLSGLAWDRGGWPGLALAVAACLGLALALGLWLRGTHTASPTGWRGAG